jgi:hypothetical protein
MTALAVVVTTIQAPTPSAEALLARLRPLGAPLVVVGDAKGPAAYAEDGVVFLPLGRQRELGFALAGALPQNHYARKNLGYLEAIRRGAACIYETDDDNAPLPGWQPRQPAPLAHDVTGASWVNVYRYFSREHIWPRGLPLARIREEAPPLAGVAREARAPIQQGLATGAPDVDAICRLVLGGDAELDDGPSVRLPAGAFCPINSQSTWWWPEAFPLLYLPATCSSRMTDIWRGLVAQRCLWELGAGLVFHAAEVRQERNRHDLTRDFREEVAGYLANEPIAERLRALPLVPGRGAVAGNLRACWEVLVADAHADARELALLDCWLADVAGLSARRVG